MGEQSKLLNNVECLDGIKAIITHGWEMNCFVTK